MGQRRDRLAVMSGRQPRDRPGFYVLATIGLTLLFAAGTIAAQGVSLTGDALGDGLLILMIYGSVAMLAGSIEGWRRNSLGWIAARWLLVGGVSGAVAAFTTRSGEMASSEVGLTEDLLSSVSIVGCLIGGAALTGAVVGRLIAGRPPSP